MATRISTSMGCVDFMYEDGLSYLDYLLVAIYRASMGIDSLTLNISWLLCIEHACGSNHFLDHPLIALLFFFSGGDDDV